MGEEKSSATRFLDANPELRRAMAESSVFEELKSRESLTIDGENLYVVRGDTLGDEDELFLDALARGSRPTAQDELSRALFLELSDELKAVVEGRLGRR